MKQLDEVVHAVKLPKCWRIVLHVEASRSPDCQGHVTAFSNEVLAGTQILHTLYHLLEIPPEICEMFDTLRQVYNLFLIRDMLRRPGKVSILLQHRHMLDANLLHLCNKLKLHLAVDLLCLHRKIYAQCTCRDIDQTLLHVEAAKRGGTGGETSEVLKDCASR